MLFVDITEIYFLARKTAEVTGIQRVVLEVAYELVRKGDAQLVLTHPFENCFRLVDPGFMQADRLYDAPTHRRALGAAPKVRSLDKYRNRGVKRAIMLARSAVMRALPIRYGPSVGDPIDLRGGKLLYLGGFTHNSWICRKARALAPDLTLGVLIHDVIPIMNQFGLGAGERVAFERAFAAVVETRARVLSNSRFTAADIEAAIDRGALPSLTEKIHVTPLAHEMRPPAQPAPHVSRPPFLLTVGAVHGRKNVRLLFEAVLMLRAEGFSALPRHIVCAGRVAEHGTALLSSDPRFEALAGDVEFVDQPDHATLYALYQQCDALVFPTIYEGWGLPVGEALWLDRPVFSSSATSLPEVGGDRALYFQPDDAASLADRLRNFYEDPALRQHLAQRRSAPGMRSWADVAADMVAALE